MHVLALDTTTRAGSVAIVEDARVVIEGRGDETRGHAERLPSALVDCLARAGLTTGDVGCFAVASGPGSFTGLRIGIATMQGLAFVHQKPVVAVSALVACAQSVGAGLAAGSRIGVWMDAHRRDVFSALFLVEGTQDDGLLTLSEVEASMVGPPRETFDRWLAAGLSPNLMCGDGAAMYGPLFPSGMRVAGVVPLAGVIGRIAAMDARMGRTLTPAAVQPLYVRRPDAEIAREAARTEPR